jgi:UDP-N-acetylmuramoylalanine--D-glutamate ligase
MIDLLSLQKKKIALLGLGQEGLSTARYLQHHGLRVSILDENPSLEIPRDLVNIETQQLGPNYLEGLDQYDLVFRSPGIRATLPALQSLAAEKITSQTKFFFDNSPAQIIGVTGTKGKGTTSSLIYQILQLAGKKSFLGGNIGAPSLDFLDSTDKDSWVVLELSSFQLDDLHKSPRVAVVLKISSDHADYHLTEGAYWDAKANIVSHQTEEDYAVLNHDSAVSLSFSHKTKAHQLLVSTKTEVNPGVYLQNDDIMTHVNGALQHFMKTEEVPLIGSHNLENVIAAIAVGKLLAVPDETIKQAIRKFKGLEHRLQMVGEVKGVKFYDDSASTNPETTIAALHSFNKPAVFILGGSSKGSDFGALGQEIALSSNVVGLFLIGEEADKIEKAVRAQGTFSGFILRDSKNFSEIVPQAMTLTPHGGVVVLSPGCASFDLFKNYADRGNQFQKEVSLLHEKPPS